MMAFALYFGFTGAVLFTVAAGMILLHRHRRLTYELYDDIDKIRTRSARQRKRISPVVAGAGSETVSQKPVELRAELYYIATPSQVEPISRSITIEPAKPLMTTSTPADDEPVVKPLRKAPPLPSRLPAKPIPSQRPTQPASRPDLPETLCVSEPTLVPGFSVVTEEEVTGAYNDRLLEFVPRFHPVRAAASTEQRQRTFIRDDDGDYWMVFRSADIRYVVPYPGIELDDAGCQKLATAFRLSGHRTGYRYRKLKLLRPAIFSGHGLVRPGALALEEGEPDVDFD